MSNGSGDPAPAATALEWYRGSLRAFEQQLGSAGRYAESLAAGRLDERALLHLLRAFEPFSSQPLRGAAGEALSGWVAANERLQQAFAPVPTRAAADLHASLVADPAPSLIDLFERWSDLFEARLQQCLVDPAFGAAFGEAVNSALRAYREASHAAAAGAAGQFGGDLRRLQADVAALAARVERIAGPGPEPTGAAPPGGGFSLDTARVLDELQQWQSLNSRLLALPAPGAASGATPREEVFRRDALRLYRYGRNAGVPLLIVFALVNRPGVLDLDRGRSLIGALVQRGLDVYLLDWGDPQAAHGPQSGMGLADYVGDLMPACVEHIRALRAAPAVDLLGVCQGGVFTLCYTALFPNSVRRLVTMVTPVDFHTPDNALSNLLSNLDARALAETFGDVPGALVTQGFLALKPYSLGPRKLIESARCAGDEAQRRRFQRMQDWIHDAPDLAGGAFVEFVEAFFQHNRLVTGGLEIGGRAVLPGRIRQPVLNVYATRDHLVPPAAARALAGLVPSAGYSELAVEAGHIGIYVSRRAAREVPRAIADWLLD